MLRNLLEYVQVQTDNNLRPIGAPRPAFQLRPDTCRGEGPRGIWRDLMEWKEQTIRPLTQEAMSFIRNLSRQVIARRWEEARATGEKLELVQLVMDAATAAPSWPISYSGIIVDYLLPSLISAGLSYGLTRLNLWISPEGALILENLIAVLTRS